MKKIAIFSKGILKLNNINQFLLDNEVGCFFPLSTSFDAVLGWGFKPTAKRARDYAAKHQLPYIALEDGFLRSVGLGVEGAQALSLVADEIGIYYDARQPSRLEQLIFDSNDLSDDLLIKSRRCINAIKEHKLSKYNQHKNDENLQLVKPKVVVIDQTQGDASVEGAMANKATFEAMLRAAVDNHPNDDIWVKVHPDVICGKKHGFLYPLPFQHPNIRVHSDAVNPWDFLDTAEHVYTVSSLMGFEALMAGCKVSCFGMPFYAGWGLTEDKLSCERRGVIRSLEQVFAAAYLQYARYVDPIIGKRCELEDTLAYVVDNIRHQSHQPADVSVSGISWWKQRWLSDFTTAWSLSNVADSNTNLVWGRKPVSSGELETIYRIEDGFIRSVGLGVHFNRPASLVCDRQGIYFDATQPSDLESVLAGYDFDDWLLNRAEKLIEQLNQQGITKYNVGQSRALNLPAEQRLILIPGQVEGDASIQYGSPQIKTNSQLLESVKEANPDAYIIYKPHPDVLAGQRDEGKWQGRFTEHADLVVTDVAMDSLLEAVDEVHTMTSLAGFEALLRGKKVVTYGMPFYAGWGLTHDQLQCERRQRKLSLAELVAGALILYPTYIDPVTRQLCTVEQIVHRMREMRAGDVQVRDTKLQCLLFMKAFKRKIKNLIV